MKAFDLALGASAGCGAAAFCLELSLGISELWLSAKAPVGQTQIKSTEMSRSVFISIIIISEFDLGGQLNQK